MSNIDMSRRRIMIGGAMAGALAALVPAAAMASAPKENYAERTLTIGLFSGDISALAAIKAAHPVVQRFAKLEHDEASAVGGLLLGAGAATPQRPRDFADTVAKLKQMDRGTAFDLLYVDTEIEGHKALLGIQAGQVKVGGSGLDVTVATILVPFIESHLDMLHAVRTDLSA
ncbi:DUF4142 domain-containing protein [Martelella endophytica]|uniref:Uncharacterized protein n=1 Tax=Martelella endophytica TaxID=1486262 RepID=A0A0D5LP02_MAREN|nr:DUF4142 domain-containing protein [Martelella endophytica]AJY45954.1 hypothetical protein TM49_10190 [Martelella endophytica]